MANVTLAPTLANDKRCFGRVALVHDWLTAYAGSEKVVEQILQLFPQADLYSIVDFFPESQRDVLGGKRAHTSFIQHLPRARKWFRHYLPLMPLAIEQFDLSGYDLVISSNHAVAKGVLTGPHQVHVSYVHSPIRYAWDLQHQYLAEAGMQHGMKSLDRASAASLHAHMGSAHRAWCGCLCRQFCLRWPAHPEGLRKRRHGGLSARRCRAVRTLHRA